MVWHGKGCEDCDLLSGARRRLYNLATHKSAISHKESLMRFHTMGCLLSAMLLTAGVVSLAQPQAATNSAPDSWPLAAGRAKRHRRSEAWPTTDSPSCETS